MGTQQENATRFRQSGQMEYYLANPVVQVRRVIPLCDRKQLEIYESDLRILKENPVSNRHKIRIVLHKIENIKYRISESGA